MSASAYKALEQQLDILQFYASDIAPHTMAGSRFEEGAEQQRDIAEAKRIADVVVNTCKNANPYYVGTEIKRMLWSSRESFPKDAVLTRDLLPTPAGFVYLEENLELPYTQDNFPLPLTAIGWHIADVWNRDLRDTTDGPRSGAMLTFYGPSVKPGEPDPWEDKLQLMGSTQVQFGRPMDALEGLAVPLAESDIVATDAVKRGARVVICHAFSLMLFHFMNQRIAGLHEDRVPRPMKRRLERANQVVPIIRTVVLRAREHTPHARETGEPEYQIGVRYIRRGHWHSYWCQGKSKECLTNRDHTEPRKELRWIDATVCGPDGAPLKEQNRLFAVVR